MVEIHDASTHGGKAALFGFLGVPADERRRVSEEELIAACRTQFVRLFGSQAENPEAEFIKDWAKEIYTATHKDERSSGNHPMPALSPSSGAWANRVTGIGSEWSREFTGYLAGAIDAVNRGLEYKNSTHQDDAMSKSPLAQPLKLPCGAVLPNRLAKAAMTEGLADDQLHATPAMKPSTVAGPMVEQGC